LKHAITTAGHEVFIKLTPGSTPIRVRANTTVDGIKKVLEEEHGVKIRSLWRGSVQLAGGSSPAAGTILEAKVGEYFSFFNFYVPK
jgi:hypothetical protein